MWGMWEIDPETGKEIAKKALSEEKIEDWEPELDLSVFDEVDWGKDENLLIWSEWEDTLIDSEITEDETPQLQETSEIEQIQAKGEYMPLFWKFAGESKLNWKDLTKLQEANITSENCETTIQACDIDSAKQTELLESIQYLQKPERIKQAEWELNKEFSDVFKDGQLNSKSWEPVWKSDFHAQAFSVISEHYMGWETKTSEERNEDLSLAMCMAAEKLWSKAQVNLNTGNTEFFNKNLSIAKNEQAWKTEQFEALTNLSEINNHVEWVKWKGKQKEQIRVSGERKLAEVWKLELFQQQLVTLKTARENKNTLQVKEITAQLQSAAEISQLSDSEIWSFDLALEWEQQQSENPSETA
jgi:hypothetical protein